MQKQGVDCIETPVDNKISFLEACELTCDICWGVTKAPDLDGPLATCYGAIFILIFLFGGVHHFLFLALGETKISRQNMSASISEIAKGCKGSCRCFSKAGRNRPSSRAQLKTGNLPPVCLGSMFLVPLLVDIEE